MYSRNFRNIIEVGVAVVFFLLITSCSVNQKAVSGQGTGKLQDSILMDTENNQYIIRLLKDNNLWMTDNLKLNVPGSFCYDNNVSNCEQYGRLYTWEAAQKVCAMLGEGWRLPANEDWQKLAGSYAAMANDSGDARKIAYQSLTKNGNAHFNAVLGGGRNPDGSYARLEAHGFYWTTTQDSSNAWFANFGKGSQALYHQDGGEKARAFAVRCMKDKNPLTTK